MDQETDSYICYLFVNKNNINTIKKKKNINKYININSFSFAKFSTLESAIIFCFKHKIDINKYAVAKITVKIDYFPKNKHLNQLMKLNFVEFVSSVVLYKEYRKYLRMLLLK